MILSNVISFLFKGFVVCLYLSQKNLAHTRNPPENLDNGIVLIKGKLIYNAVLKPAFHVNRYFVQIGKMDEYVYSLL